MAKQFMLKIKSFIDLVSKLYAYQVGKIVVSVKGAFVTVLVLFVLHTLLGRLKVRLAGRRIANTLLVR
jgi:hypothetical protein